MKSLGFFFGLIILVISSLEVNAEWIPASDASPVPSTVGVSIMTVSDDPSMSPKSTKYPTSTTTPEVSTTVTTKSLHSSSSRLRYSWMPTFITTHAAPTRAAPTYRPRRSSSRARFTWDSTLTNTLEVSAITTSTNGTLQSRQTAVARAIGLVYDCGTSASSPTSEDVNKAAQGLTDTAGGTRCTQEKFYNLCTEVSTVGTASIGICGDHKWWAYCSDVGGHAKELVKRCGKRIGGKMLVGGKVKHSGGRQTLFTVYHS